MSEYEKAMNSFKTALYNDCKAQLLKCKRLTATKQEAVAAFELGQASGIISLFTKAYGVSDQSIELSEIFESIRIGIYNPELRYVSAAQNDRLKQLLADIKTFDVSEYLLLPLEIRKRIQLELDA